MNRTSYVWIAVLLLLPLLPGALAQQPPGPPAPRPGAADLIASATAVVESAAETRSALQSGIFATAEPLTEADQLQARITEAAGTLQARGYDTQPRTGTPRDIIVRPGAAAATQLAAGSLDFGGTATAVFNSVQAQLGSVPPDVRAVLDNLSGGTTTYDPQTGVLTINTLVSEAQANELIDTLATSSGQIDPDAVFVRFESNIAVVTAVSGALVYELAFDVSADAGAVAVTLVEVTVNGDATSLDSVPDGSALVGELGLSGSVLAPVIDTTTLAYTIDDVQVVPGSLIVTISLLVG